MNVDQHLASDKKCHNSTKKTIRVIYTLCIANCATYHLHLLTQPSSELISIMFEHDDQVIILYSFSCGITA